MKLLSPETQATIHITCIDGVITFHMVLWKQIFSGMIDDMLISPIILDDIMTGHNYLDFLQNGLPVQLEDVPLATQIATYFQHDGNPFSLYLACDATSQ
jgi:hypothetical protein